LQIEKGTWIKMFFGITVIIGLLLFAAAVMDFKSKSIGRGFLFVLILASFISIFVRVDFEIWSSVGGALIGLCAVGLSMISREQIGRGDGIVITALGVALGFWDCLAAVSLASIIMALVSVVILILKKGNRNTRLPFIPALFVGYVTCLMM